MKTRCYWKLSVVVAFFSAIYWLNALQYIYLWNIYNHIRLWKVELPIYFFPRNIISNLIFSEFQRIKWVEWATLQSLLWHMASDFYLVIVIIVHLFSRIALLETHLQLVQFHIYSYNWMLTLDSSWKLQRQYWILINYFVSYFAILLFLNTWSSQGDQYSYAH